MQQWCILRVAASRTLKLADALDREGFTCWTPREEFKRRLPRGKGYETASAPILPTFAFACASHLSDLIDLAEAFAKPVPDFSVQRHYLRYPLVNDSELGPLRLAERRRAPIKPAAPFTPGEIVKLTEGGFSGMTGIVQTSDGKYTLIAFPGFNVPIRIATLHLRPDNATAAQHTAAMAA